MALLALSSLALAVPAVAGELLQLEVVGPDEPFDLDGVVPGTSRSKAFVIGTSATELDSRLAISVDGLIDHENGCLTPETAAGDDTCGEQDGELSEWLVVSAELTNDGNCAGPGTEVLAATPLGALPGGEIVELGDEVIPASEERCLLLTFDFLFATDNTTQTDGISFDLTVYVEDDLEAAEVLGVVLERDEGAQTSGSVAQVGGLAVDLPATGLDSKGVLLAGVSSLALGTAVLRAPRREDDGRHGTA